MDIGITPVKRPSRRLRFFIEQCTELETYRKWVPCGTMALVLLLLGLLHWWSAPRDGDYWWPDSSRHMLNAIFVKDAFIALPFQSPMAWAEAYYNQYPALTIGFYPPGFAVGLGVLFFALGASHGVAQVFMTCSFLLLALSTALIARARAGTVAGFIAGLLLLTAPALLTWSRQVQPEVPAMALAMGAVALAKLSTRYSSRIWMLLVTATFVVALYFKQTAIIFTPLIVWGMWPGAVSLSGVTRRYLMPLGLGAVLLIPLVVIQMQFGRENLRSVQGIPDAPHQLWEIDNWTWYWRHLDNIAGWPLMIATGIGVVVLVFGKDRRDRAFAFLLIGFLLLIYAVFSFVALKEERHIQALLIPMVLLGCLGMSRLLQMTRAGWLGAAAIVLWASIDAMSFRAPRITGLEAAAAWVTRSDSPPCTVLIHAAQDGNFITNLRLSDTKRQCTALRSDKILFDITIRREMGISERSVSPEDLRRLFFDLGVRYVVMDTGFWDDLANSQMLVSTVRSGGFIKRVQFPLKKSLPGLPVKELSTIEIYENIEPIRDQPLRLKVKSSQ